MAWYSVGRCLRLSQACIYFIGIYLEIFWRFAWLLGVVVVGLGGDNALALLAGWGSGSMVGCMRGFGETGRGLFSSLLRAGAGGVRLAW